MIQNFILFISLVRNKSSYVNKVNIIIYYAFIKQYRNKLHKHETAKTYFHTMVVDKPKLPLFCIHKYTYMRA